MKRVRTYCFIDGDSTEFNLMTRLGLSGAYLRAHLRQAGSSAVSSPQSETTVTIKLDRI